MEESKTRITLDKAMQLAAKAAVDTWVKADTAVIGIGTGQIVEYIVARIAQRIFQEGKPCDIVCIPTSFYAQRLILEHRLVMGDLDCYPRIDVTFDGVDEVDSNMTIIKGGNGYFVQEKILAYNSKHLIVVGDYMNKSTKLGEKWCKGIPIEVIPRAWIAIRKRIKLLYDGEPELRLGLMKSGPVITSNNNYIIDWHFVHQRVYDWEEVNDRITLMPGVVGTGLFVDMATKAYFAMADGTVKAQTMERRNKCKEL